MSVISPQVRPGPAAEPRAARIQSPGWRNPRLLIGLLLVFASIATGARVIAAADRTVPVFAAARDLPTGTALAASDLVVVRLRLTGTDARYLAARDPLPASQVLSRPVGAGEVVPVAALVPADQLRLRPVTIPLDGPVPGGLAVGSRVDVWASAKAGTGSGATGSGTTGSGATGGGTGGSGAVVSAPAGSYLDAQRIAAAAEVAAVAADSRALSAASGTAVQILVPAQALPAVLNALANDARIAVLPIPGAGTAREGR